MGTGFDKNTIIGMVLIVILAIGLIYTGQKQTGALQKQRQHIEDSTRQADALKAAQNAQGVDVRKDSLSLDSALRSRAAGHFAGSVIQKDQETTMENDLVRLTFTNRGGELNRVELKNYKRFDGTPLDLVSPGDQIFKYNIQTGVGSTAWTNDLYFEAGSVEKQGENQILRYTLHDSLGHSIVQEYVLEPHQYMVKLNIQVTGARELMPQGTLDASWEFTAMPQEKDITYEKRTTALSWYDKDGYDYKTLSSNGNKDLTELTWIGTKQRFFNNTLISKDNKFGATLAWEANPDSTHDLVKTTATMTLKLPPGETVNLPLEWYAGPNDYHILKQYGLSLEENVQMGNGIYAFCKYINRWIVLPVFDFFHSFIADYGIVILLLTFFIRLVISPLTYTSYLSGAKMRVLRPEIDELKKKYKDDQQTFGMEQMKLFRAAGVNPLGGCIPALLQIPIFFALYSFFNSNIALRGQPFLWAHDLSTYDSIWNFGFKIPLYGDHMSLFTLTAIVSSFLIQIWNMNMTPDQNNPMMKYMPYIFPVVLLGVFNGLPSGLTWYYTVSNVITLGIQLVIQKFIINEKKLHAQLQENKKKPKVKTKWQERLEQIQETQKQAQTGKNKAQKR